MFWGGLVGFSRVTSVADLGTLAPPYMDQPKLLGNEVVIQARSSEIDDVHIAALSGFVRRLRKSAGAEAAIPYFDPRDGGVEAEVLFLLEAPGAKAIASGFVSLNNPDETSKNFFELIHAVPIARRRIVIWNIVPWYIGSGKKIRPATGDDIDDGQASLAELLGLLPALRAIVLVGRKAQKAEQAIRRMAPSMKVFACPHPSPMFVNRKPENQAKILHSLRGVGAFLDG
jgi:uracil-DNA glycosylase